MDLGKGRFLHGYKRFCLLRDELRIMSGVRRWACCTTVHLPGICCLCPGDQAILSTGDVLCSRKTQSSFSSVPEGCIWLPVDVEWRTLGACDGEPSLLQRVWKRLLGLGLEPLSPARTLCSVFSNQGPGRAWMHSDIQGSPPH